VRVDGCGIVDNGVESVLGWRCDCHRDIAVMMSVVVVVVFLYQTIVF